MCSLVAALFGLGVAVGVLIENIRMHSIAALERDETERAVTAIDYLNFFTAVVQEQNKKLDMIAKKPCRACSEDPEITQDMPIMKKD